MQRTALIPRRMASPIAQLQRQLYPWEPHPLATTASLRRHLSGLGTFGDLQQGITGVKAGVSAGTTATAIGTGVATAIGAGAAAGSVVPIIGTAIGAIVGLVASGIFNHRVDPEVGNFNNAMALVKAQGPQAVLGIEDKYLVLAGLFDLEPNQIKGNIPIYKKYGRMGEQKFVTDMCNLIQQAANQGIITANDTVQSVYDKVVAPWIAGFGYGPMQDSNSEMITTLILGLIGEYVSGQYKTRWYARGGDFAFNNLPLFTLPPTSAVAPTPSGTPTPITNPPNPASIPTTVPAGFAWVGTSQYGQALYARAGDPGLYALSNGQLTAYTGAYTPAGGGPLTQSNPAPPPQQSAVPIPSGFQMVGMVGSLPAYQGPDGYFYVWSGTTMSPATGTLQTGTGQAFAVNSGVPATQTQSVALPSLTSNTQAGVSPYAASAPTPDPFAAYTAPTVPLPSIVTPAGAPVAAGVDTSGLPSWLSWSAVAGVVVLMLATARPVSPRGARRRVTRRAAA